MRRVVVVFVLFVLAAVPARGQVTSSDSTHAAAAGELVDLLKLGERQMPDFSQLTAGFGVQSPMAAEMGKLVTEFVQEVAPWEKVRPEVVRIYQTAYSEAELRQLIAFYRSPIGQRAIEKEPEITKGMMEMTQKLLMPHMMELQQRMMSRMGVGGGQE